MTTTEEQPSVQSDRSENGFVKVLLTSFALLVVTMVLSYNKGIRYNGSPSYPKGFYRTIVFEGAPEIGRLVFVCPPDTDVFREARRRHYIGPGMCEGKFTPIIKRVVATEGAQIQTQGAILVDGVQQPNSTIYPQDGEGRPLPTYEGGILGPDEYLLLSDHFAGSFDSRYFGPLKREQIVGYAQPVLTR